MEGCTISVLIFICCKIYIFNWELIISDHIFIVWLMLKWDNIKNCNLKDIKLRIEHREKKNQIDPNKLGVDHYLS